MLSQLEDRLGRDDMALRHYQDMTALESRLGNRPDVARAQFAIGQIHLNHGRSSEAVVALTDASDFARQMDDPEFSTRVNGLLGRALMDAGREADALNALEIAVRGSRSAGDVTGEARWLIAAGEAMLRSGETTNAAALAERAEELARMTADNSLRSEVYNLVGQVALVERRLQDAEDAFMSATAAARAAGQQGDSLHYLPLLARVASEMEDIEGALRYIDLAVDEATSTNDRRRIPSLQIQAGRLLSKVERSLEAEQRFTMANDIAEEVGDPRSSGHALLGIGAIYDRSEDLDIALDFYRDALQYALAADDKQTIAMANHNIGAVLVDMDRDDEARSHLIQARDTAEEIRNQALAERARALLRVLAPPSIAYNPFDDESTDFPISEEPSRPRNDPPPY
jgi:tetratricopeptide (TPR) repeat protein